MPGLPTIEGYQLPEAGNLPPNLVHWTLDPDRAVLLVHDMQGYFLDPLPTRLRGQLVHNAAITRKQCVAQGVPVAYTTQPGRMTVSDRGLLKDFWGPGMRTEAADRDVVPELAPVDGDLILTKWRYSAFFRTELLSRMREWRRDQLIICGVYAHVGVLMSAVEAFTNDIKPFLVADATADFSETEHRLALTYTARRCGMVVTSGEVCT